MSRRRRGCSPLAILVVLVLLVGGLAFADRWAVGTVEDEVGGMLRTQLGLPADPAVEIHGFPFLTQAAMNRFDRVDLSGSGIQAGTAEEPLLVDRMNLRLGGVQTSNDYRRIDAANLDGEAYVTWSEISARVGAPIRPEADGRVRVDVDTNLYGQQVSFVVTARPVLDARAQEIRLAEPKVSVADYQVPDSVVQRIAADNVPPVHLSLPLGLRSSSLAVGREHLQLGLEGSNVRLVG